MSVSGHRNHQRTLSQQFQHDTCLPTASFTFTINAACNSMTYSLVSSDHSHNEGMHADFACLILEAMFIEQGFLIGPCITGTPTMHQLLQTSYQYMRQIEYSQCSVVPNDTEVICIHAFPACITPAKVKLPELQTSSITALSYLSYEGGSDNDNNDNDQSDSKVSDDGLPTGQMRAMNLDSRGNSHSSSVSMLCWALRPGVPPTIGVDAMQALIQAEIQIAEVNKRLKQSEQERRELADALRLTKRREKGLRQRKVQECTQKYAVLYWPWASKLTCDMLSVHRPVVDEARRYDSTESQEKAHQAEMWDILAANPDVKPILGFANWLHGAFCKVVHEEKSKFVHAAVVNVVNIFSSLGVNSESVGTAAARKACKALQAIGLQNANHLYPDILFPDDRPGQLAWLSNPVFLV
ncbi:hypothetical protein BC835DRAFT_1310869 [Cytidiella melzeri]|nr:hypothetical protein BC835DRAFT_1310869 [Cytidiella melzeri]